METLEKIFGGVDKVKTMRLFLFNPVMVFDVDDIAKRTKIQKIRVRKEVKNLERIGLIKKKITASRVADSKKKSANKKKKVGWILNEKFTFLDTLQNFLINITSTQHKEIVDKIKKVGSIRLLILSGVFIQEWDTRLDILIVGDKIKKNALLAVISEIESEVGKEMRYSFFETSEFLYRLGVCDKLIRDVLDYPHKKLINKMELY